MTDWTRGYAQSFEYYEVDPATWLDRRPLSTVVSCSVVRDSETAIIERATFEIDGESPGESWIRAYMVAEQDGISERVPIGTWLVQTPRTSMDGRVASLHCDAYSPLHVLSEWLVPVGWHAQKGAICAETAAAILRRYGVAPVIASYDQKTLGAHYVPEGGASWLDVAKDIAAAADMEIGVDAYGRVILAPISPTASLLPSWTFEDGDRSILLADAEQQEDWYGVPNAIEVVSSKSGLVGRAVNDDPEDMLSLVRRGRAVTKRFTDPPELASATSQAALDAVAKMLLAEESQMERTVTISHGWCPLNVGMCARVLYTKHGLDVTGTVIRQDFSLETGLTVKSVIKTSKRK